MFLPRCLMFARIRLVFLLLHESRVGSGFGRPVCPSQHFVASSRNLQKNVEGGQ